MAKNIYTQTNGKHQHTLRLLAIVLTLCCSVLSLHAYDFEVDGIYYDVVASTRTASVTYKYLGRENYSDAVDIPAKVEYDGVVYSITGIGHNAFMYCKNLTSVTIPNSVTFIDYKAFSGCYSLSSITIPDGVTSIGNAAFESCRSLTLVTIPDGVSSISSDLFYGCSGLTSVTYSDNVTSIGDSAFKGCSGLTGTLTFPSSVTEIGAGAFAYCTGLTDVVIPDGLTTISEETFYSCTGLTSLNIPRNVASIGDGAFNGCDGLSSLTIPSTVISIGESAFWACEGLTEVVIEDGTDTLNFPSSFISESPFKNSPIEKLYVGRTIIGIAFSGLSALKSVAIGDYVKSIPGGAFLACHALTDVNFGNSVAEIGSNAFYNCEHLTSVAFPNNVTDIREGTFLFCRGLKYVSFHNSMTSIGRSAFYGCTGLTELTIPNSVTSIGAEAFRDCDSLVSVIIADGTEVLEFYGSTSFTGCPIEMLYLGRNISNGGSYDSTFGGFKTMKSLVIGDSVTFIDYNAFRDCSGLAGTLVIPKNVTKIGESAFSWCTGLTEVVFSDGADTLRLAETPFRGCSIERMYLGRSIDTQSPLFGDEPSIKALTIGEDVAFMIGRAAFYSCSGLTELVIPDKVTTIGDGYFYGCNGLTKLRIGNSVTNIGGYAFWGCNGLTELVIPNSVTKIGNEAFYGCKGLAELAIGNGVTRMDTHAFAYCSGLTKLTIPNNVTWIGYGAFSGCSNLTDVTIEDGTEELKFYKLDKVDSHFKNCPIERLYLGRDISDYSPFNGLYTIKTLTIGGCVTSIRDYAFSNCTSLVSVTSLNPTPPEIFSATFNEETEGTAMLHVPQGCKNIYAQTSYWENFFNIIDDMPTGINSRVENGFDRQGINIIYTLNGVKLPTTNVSDLPKGIYIVNGKKIAVK